MRNRERERRAQRKRREQEIRLQMFVLAVGAALLLFLVIVGIGRWREAVAERKRLEAERALLEREEELLSDSVLEYEDLVKYYAEEEGIYEYVPVLLAIMEVETKGEHSFDLAVEYAKEMSGGRTAKYTHDIADFNGNWMYLYGNMYYVLLVEQYLP